MPPGVDWNIALPAVRALVNGSDPYAYAVFNPPWAFAPLIPFVLLPDPLGRMLLFMVAFVSIGFTAYRLGGRFSAILAVLLSPLTMNALLWGNTEWLALLGLVITPEIGLILLAIKPQVTFIAMALLAYRERRNPQVFVPFALLTVASLLWFGPYPLRFFWYANYAAASNTSMFPVSVPFGVVLVYQAFKANKTHPAIAASLMLAPSLSQTAWAGLSLVLVEYPILSVLATAALWASTFATGSLWWFR